MRMVVISFIVLLIMILIWIWFHFTSIELITSFFWEDLINLSNCIYNDNWDKAESNLAIYIKKWESARNLWIYFINQKDIDQIDRGFKMLNVYINNLNKTMAQAQIEELRLLFNVIKENECLSLENIF